LLACGGAGSGGFRSRLKMIAESSPGKRGRVSIRSSDIQTLPAPCRRNGAACGTRRADGADLGVHKMASISWKGGSGDWTNASNWSGGVEPGAGDTAVFGGTGAYTATLYSAAAIGAVTMNDANALFYDSGLLTLGGVFALQAGTFALAYGVLQGGTLALDGGVLGADGGTLDGVAVQGTLAMGQTNAALFVQGGLTMAGAGGTGSGTIVVNGSYATLDFLGTQILANAVVKLGSTGAGPNQGGAGSIGVSDPFGVSTGSTLTLASNVWVQETGTVGQIIVGGGLPGPLTDEVINQGTITNATANGTLTLTGPGIFDNAGTIGISNGATLDIATNGFVNTGTIVVADATLDFGGTFSASELSGLGKLSLTAATVEIGGDAVNTGGSIAIGSATALGPILLAGTITGGTVTDSGGGLNLSAGTGILDGVAYHGSLSLGQDAILTLADSTTLSDGGGAGTASITAPGATLLLECLTQSSTTLDNATIALGSSSGVATIGTADSWLADAATGAILGSHLVINQAGKFAAIDANATTPVQGYGLTDLIDLNGTINAGFAGGTLTIGGYGVFINDGEITVSNQDTLVADAMGFDNWTTIAVTGGATAILGGPVDAFGQSPSWSNVGTIELNGGTLVLSGAAATGDIGKIVSTNGSVALTGTLANAGSTLTIGSGGMLPSASLNGTIDGGAITDSNGLLTIGSAGTALLDGVAYTGTLNLSHAGAWLRIRDGLALTGEAEITGAGAVLAFNDSETLDKAVILLGANGTAATLDVLHDGNASGPTTLTLGPNLTVTQAGTLADIGAVTDTAGDGIASYGTINAATAGGLLTLGGSNFTNHGKILVSNGDTLALAATGFANTGTISLTDAELSIADSLSVAGLGKLVLNNAEIAVSGTLTDSGGTLSIGAGSAWGRLALTGEISGGVIADSGGGLNAAGGATLNDVTYQGVLDLSRPFQQLAVTGGISVTGSGGSGAGTILLTGADSRLLAESTETIDNATIYLGSATQTYYGQHVNPPELAVTAGNTLTLGPQSEVQSAGLVGWLGDYTEGNWTDTIINEGTVLAASANGILTLGSSFFNNQGGIVIGNDGNVMFAGVDMMNAGNIAVNGGSSLMLSLLGYYEAPNSGPTIFTNTGTIKMVGGAFQELTGGGLFPAVPILNATGGLIQGLGNIIAPIINDGKIDSKYGPNLTINGAVTGTGLLEVETGCVLELTSAVASTQTVSFTATGETLRIDDPQAFSAAITGFAGGDVVDIAGTPINTVAVSSGTLVLGTGYGVFKLHTTTPIGGEVSVGADTHLGSVINYLAQPQGSSAATITAYEPKMLFWASPVGDEFQGTSANLQDATIANFGTTDSLDFVDMLGTRTTVAYAQATGQGTITVTDGTHTDTIGVLGSYNASWFHVQTDAKGGALITYSQH
jgi:fibronectin-binding autotransporter adhesin